jgi:hypothetical protein
MGTAEAGRALGSPGRAEPQQAYILLRYAVKRKFRGRSPDRCEIAVPRTVASDCPEQSNY